MTLKVRKPPMLTTHKVCWFQFWSYSINNVCRRHGFGHIQLLMFVIVMFRSYSFGQVIIPL